MRPDDIARPPETIQPCECEDCRAASLYEIVTFLAAVAAMVAITCGAILGTVEFFDRMGWWPQ
jgi:hypothetical protein